MKTDKQQAEDHKYVTRHGLPWDPGVTTIVNQLGKDGLQWGAAKETANIAIYHPEELRRFRTKEAKYEWLRKRFQELWDAKRDRGSAVHQHALDWASGRSVDQQPDERGYLDALERFIVDHRVAWRLLEGVVLRGDVRDLAYGGRFDFIGDIEGRCSKSLCPCQEGALGDTWLGDYKTGGRYLEGPTLQLAAYDNAEGTPVYDDAGALREIEPLPSTDKRVAVYLGGDGDYTCVALNSDQDAFRAFLHLRMVYGWRKQYNKWERQYKKEEQHESE